MPTYLKVRIATLMFIEICTPVPTVTPPSNHRNIFNYIKCTGSTIQMRTMSRTKYWCFSTPSSLFGFGSCNVPHVITLTHFNDQHTLWSQCILYPLECQTLCLWWWKLLATKQWRTKLKCYGLQPKCLCRWPKSLPGHRLGSKPNFFWFFIMLI